MQTAFFLDSVKGKIFCTGFVERDTERARRCVLLLPPFAEEMNKARFFYARIAERLFEAGFNVLSVDLFGTGDSEGGYRDASIETWRADVDAVIDYLKPYDELNLLGLRFGCLLAADALARHEISRMVLLQPQVSGKKQLDEFLRLSVMSGVISGEKNRTVGELRDSLDNGETLELAGYELTPRLANGLCEMALERITVADKPKLYWWELTSDLDGNARRSATTVRDAWLATGAQIQFKMSPCPTFWLARETTSCPGLIDTVSQTLRVR